MNNPPNQANLFGTPVPNSDAQKPKQANNFIEALREQGKVATSGVFGGMIDQLTGRQTNPNAQTYPNFNQFPQPNLGPNQAPFNFAEFLRLRENKIRQQERNLSQQQRRTETVLYNQKEESAKKEIEFIKAEIKKIITATEGISEEIINAEKTVMSTTVEAGVYQLNFFARIRQLLALARKKLTESQHWLELFNTRKNQRSYYWGQVKKSGTKFLLSQERYMSTQAG